MLSSIKQGNTHYPQTMNNIEYLTNAMQFGTHISEDYEASSDLRKNKDLLKNQCFKRSIEKVSNVGVFQVNAAA